MRAETPNGVEILSNHLETISSLLSPSDPMADRLALATALPILRRAMLGLPLPSERRQARSAYRMCAAALGVEHD
jgi:hypothetical protein